MRQQELAMTNDDIIGRLQKRLDVLTGRLLRELIDELTDVIADKDADIASLAAEIASLAAEIVSLRNQLAAIIPVHERQAELDSHG
jgi:hypothetical protein